MTRMNSLCLHHPEYDHPPFRDQTKTTGHFWFFHWLSMFNCPDWSQREHLWSKTDCSARAYKVCVTAETPRHLLLVVHKLSMAVNAKSRKKNPDISHADDIFRSRQPFKAWCVVTELDCMTTPAASLPQLSPSERRGWWERKCEEAAEAPGKEKKPNTIRAVRPIVLWLGV